MNIQLAILLLLTYTTTVTANTTRQQLVHSLIDEYIKTNIREGQKPRYTSDLSILKHVDVYVIWEPFVVSPREAPRRFDFIGGLLHHLHACIGPEETAIILNGRKLALRSGEKGKNDDPEGFTNIAIISSPCNPADTIATESTYESDLAEMIAAADLYAESCMVPFRWHLTPTAEVKEKRKIFRISIAQPGEDRSLFDIPASSIAAFGQYLYTELQEQYTFEILLANHYQLIIEKDSSNQIVLLTDNYGEMINHYQNALCYQSLRDSIFRYTRLYEDPKTPIARAQSVINGPLMVTSRFASDSETSHQAEASSIVPSHISSPIARMEYILEAGFTALKNEVFSVAVALQDVLGLSFKYTVLHKISKQRQMICVLIDIRDCSPDEAERCKSKAYSMTANFGEMLYAKLERMFKIHVTLENILAITVATDPNWHYCTVIEEADILQTPYKRHLKR